jgi:hypothetical protein
MSPELHFAAFSSYVLKRQLILAEIFAFGKNCGYFFDHFNKKIFPVLTDQIYYHRSRRAEWISTWTKESGDLEMKVDKRGFVFRISKTFISMLQLP